MDKPFILAGVYCFICLMQNLEYLTYILLPGFRMSTQAKNVPQVVYYQKQVGDFGAIFVRKHPLAPRLGI